MMAYQDCLAQLARYKPLTELEELHRQALVTMIETHKEQAFERVHEFGGHVVVNAWICNPDFTKVLLIHHKTLEKWYSPGGHCDGSSDIIEEARREGLEETGLAEADLRLVSDEIFDVDVHFIPANLKKQEPAHLHYAYSFLFVAEETAALDIQVEEVSGVQWVPVAEIPDVEVDESAKRRQARTVALQG